MSTAKRKPLTQMTAAELRAYAREQGFSITYLSERRRDDLVALIRQAERDRQSAERRAAKDTDDNEGDDEI